MPDNLIESLVTASDLQSLSGRVTEAEVVFRAGFARNYLKLAVQLYKWFRTVNSPVRLAESRGRVLGGKGFSGLGSPSALGSGREGYLRSLSSLLLDSEDIITDAGGDEEEEGDEDPEADLLPIIQG